MTPIITKDKGDIGVTSIIADLTKKNIKIALPISEHLPFDLICINQDGKLSRVSVKFLTKTKHGTVEIPFRTISSNSKGYKIKFIDWSVVDAFAVYCPDTNKCYYINKSKLINTTTGFSLRIDPTIRKRNYPEVNWAKDFENENAIFNN